MNYLLLFVQTILCAQTGSSSSNGAIPHDTSIPPEAQGAKPKNKV